jgi:hypothetical protein
MAFTVIIVRTAAVAVEKRLLDHSAGFAIFVFSGTYAPSMGTT